LNNERFIGRTSSRSSRSSTSTKRRAFYLGKELARASLAVTLGATYRQEGASWGYLTRPTTTVAITCV
jgi:hypothetical protein